MPPSTQQDASRSGRRSRASGRSRRRSLVRQCRCCRTRALRADSPRCAPPACSALRPLASKGRLPARGRAPRALSARRPRPSSRRRAHRERGAGGAHQLRSRATRAPGRTPRDFWTGRAASCARWGPSVPSVPQSRSRAVRARTAPCRAKRHARCVHQAPTRRRSARRPAPSAHSALFALKAPRRTSFAPLAPWGGKRVSAPDLSACLARRGTGARQGMQGRALRGFSSRFGAPTIRLLAAAAQSTRRRPVRAPSH